MKRPPAEAVFSASVLQHVHFFEGSCLRGEGSSTTRSPTSHFRALQIFSRSVNLIARASSWYKRLIVFGRIPVSRESSDCFIRISPSFVDSKIRTIHSSFRCNISHNDRIKRAKNRKYHYMIENITFNAGSFCTLESNRRV